MKLSNSASRSLALVMAGLVTSVAVAGGRLETYRVTNQPSPIAGHLIADVIGMQWDSRTLPVRYSMNTTLDPVPNPLGAAFLSVADAAATFEATLAKWNSIPTSFIEMHVTGTTANAGLVGFNFVNELTFRTSAGFGAIASSPSVTLIIDAQFAHGDDIDGDGDSDVSSAISTAQDVDSDGDIEFPAGLYKAGTILDNDVQYNTKASNGFRFTIDNAQLDAVTRSVGLQTVALHEFGHSFGLSHVLNNNKSPTSGREATMFPFIDTGDPVAELAVQTLDSDDVAIASLLYPEGTAASGPAALQAGDVAFSRAYGRIQGNVRHGTVLTAGQPTPVAGGSVYAVDRRTGALVSTAFSGTTRLSYNPANGGLFFLPSSTDGIVNGNFEMAVPPGNYTVGVEALDGSPAAAANISFTGQIGGFYGLLNFNEELWNGNKEDGQEKRSGDGKAVQVLAGRTAPPVKFVTNTVVNIQNFGNRNFIGFTNLGAGAYYVVRVPASQVTAAAAALGRYSIQSVLFETAVVDSSVVPLFAEAMLTTGSVDAAGNITSLDLAAPLASTSGFVAADTDFAPLFIKNPHDIGDRVREGIAAGTITDLFMVLRVPTATPFPGVSGLAPLIGLNNTGLIFGLSHTSTDGGSTFTRSNTFNFRFSLTLAPWVP